MNDFKEVIAEAKEKTFEKFIELIIEDLQLENWNGKFSKCPFHSEDSASFSPNYKNHTWHCFGCGKTYSYIDHMISHYGLKSHEAVKKILAEAEVDYIPNKKKEDVSNKKYIYPKLVDKERYQVEKYMLENRCISKSTLDFFGVTGDSYGNIIFNFYDENDILTFYKARISKDVTDKKEKKILGIKPSADPKKPEILGAGDKPILFGMNMCAPIGTLYITEGEIDSLSMHEAGISNVVSIPFGANSNTWIEYNYQWLSNFEKIVFIFDNDEAGLKARREAIVRLGNHRCRFVDIPKEYSISDDSKVHLKDANDVLVKLGKDKLFEFVQVEKELPLEGIINLEDAEDFNPESWEGIKTGIADLDKNILYKIFLGTVVTFTGTPGSGKSTVINQIFVSQAIEQGYGVTIFSGELTPSILRGWIEINMAGREHTTLKQDKENGNFIRVISKENKEKIKNWYRNKIHVLKDDDNNIDTVLSRAEQTVRVNGDKIIILDNMATLSIGDNDSNTYSKQTEMMNKLKAFAGKFNVLVVLVIHPRKPQNGGSAEGAGGYEMGGSSALYNLCHYNFSIRRISDKEKEGIKNKRDGSWKVKPNLYDSELRCHKNRLMGTIGSVMLYFDYSYRFYKYPKELWYRFAWDKDNPNPIPNHDPNSHETPFDNDDE